MKPLASGPPRPSPLQWQPYAELDLSAASDYHLHTTYTDGAASVSAMTLAAAQVGVQSILFSEHIRATSTYFPDYAAEVRTLAVPELDVYLGVEAKALDTQGTLDCSESVAEQCDALIGSVHSLPGPDGEPLNWTQIEPARALNLEFVLAEAIVKHSRAHILAHPMGMVISRLQLVPVEQVEALAQACRAHGKAFELNPRYCPDVPAWLDIVRRAGCQVSFGSDAHKTGDVGRAWRIFVLEQQLL